MFWVSEVPTGTDDEHLAGNFEILAVEVSMEEISCALCGTVMMDKEEAYGLTRGMVDKNIDGFRMDLDSEWDFYCPTCMNEVDRLISVTRFARSK